MDRNLELAALAGYDDSVLPASFPPVTTPSWNPDVNRHLYSLVLSGLFVAALQAQPTPRLTTLTPPGGQSGTNIQITLAGVDLDDVTSLMIAPAGLSAERVPNPAKKGEFLPNTFTIKIPQETLPGNFDLRAVGTFGITNPRTFVVGDLAEVQEKEPNNDIPQAQSVQLNSTINGAIVSPSDVDYYSVACKKGDTVTVYVAAESIDSRLEPDVRVFNATGRLIANNRPRSEPDGVCHFIASADGTYFVRLCAHAHVEGNAESFYRLSISTKPWIESIYPNVVEPGKAASSVLWGRNLAGAILDPTFKVGSQPLQKLNITLAPPSEPFATMQLLHSPWSPPAQGGIDAFYYRVKNATGWSNSVPIAYALAPVVLEVNDHATAAKAQSVTVPCEIIGRIEKANDRDWYAFTAKAGEVLALEGFAERMGVPMDLYFELRRDNNTVVGEYDEHPDQSPYPRFFSRTDDPSARVTIPADGKYLLMVSSRDATLRGDPRLTYRIGIHKPRPDFRAVVVDAHPQNPGALRLVAGDRQHADVVLFRKDGFAGPVTLTAEGLPTGVTCLPSLVPAGAMTGAIVLTATDKAAPFDGPITIKATATIDGQTIIREARSGCLVWPNPNEANNGPGISRLCRSTVLAVRAGQPAFRLTPGAEAVALPLGSAQNVKLKVERLWPEAKQPIIITATHLPPGVTFNNNQPFTLTPDKNEADIRLQIQGNAAIEQFPLVVRGVAQIPYAKDPKAKQKPNVQIAETAGTMNISVYRKVVEASLSQPSVEIKQGNESTIIIKLNRLNNYQGPINFQVQGAPFGVIINAATVAEKATEGKLVIKVNKTSTPVRAAGITLRSTGTVNGINLTTETKLALTINKSEPDKSKK